MGDTSAPLVGLLQELSSADNATRNRAEKQYELIKDDLSAPLELCAVVANASFPPQARQLAIVLLRRALVKPSLQGQKGPSDADAASVFFKMDDAQQEHLKDQLLILLSGLQELDLKMKVSDLVGEFATISHEPEAWRELMVYCHTCIAAPSAIEVEAGLRLFGALAYASHFSSLLSSTSGATKAAQLLCRFLADGSCDGRLAVASAQAAAALLLSLPQESDYDRFQQLLPALMAGLQKMIDLQNNGILPESVTLSYVDPLIQLMEEASGFFVQQLPAVFSAIAAMLEARPPIQTRNVLLELIVAMCEARPKAVRKIKGPAGERCHVPTRMAPICASIASAIDDDCDHWTAQLSDEGDDEGDFEVGGAALSRITRQLGLRHTYPAMSAQLSQLLVSPRWQDQHAGFCIMGDYLELTVGVEPAAQLSKHRSDVVSLLAATSSTAHARVRAACFHAMSQLFCHHGCTLDDAHTESLLRVALDGIRLSVNASARVRISALTALISIIDGARGFLDRLPVNTPQVLAAVTSALHEGPLAVQELCVTSLMSVAERASSAQIAAYYAELMPVLIQLMQYSRANSMELLWGRSLECCALIGESAGRDVFAADASAMVAMLSELQQQLGSTFDAWEGKKYFLKAWVSISRCLGAEVMPYLHNILALLFAALEQDVTVGAGGVDLDAFEDRSDIELVEDSDGMLTAVRTSAIEEQAAAAQLLYLVIERLQAAFYPYVEQAARCVIPLLKSPHEDVRSYCLVAVPELVRSAATAAGGDRNGLKAISDFLLGSLLTSVETEGVIELIMTGLQAVKMTLHYSSIDWTKVASYSEPPLPLPATSIEIYTPVQLASVSKTVKIVLRDSIQRRAVLRAEAQLGGCRDDDDADDERAFLEESMELHLNVAEVLGMLMRTHSSSYFSAFVEEWREMTLEMARDICLLEDRKFALFVICDALEFAPHSADASLYFSTTLPVLISGCSSVDSSIRQLCCYGLGAAATANPVAFSPHTSAALQVLLAAATEGRSDDASDNAVAALGYVLESREGLGVSGADSAPLSELWARWLDLLPLRNDRGEGARVIRQLVALLWRALGGASSLLLPTAEPQATLRTVQCACLLVTVHGSELSDKETDTLIAALLRALVVSGLASRLSGDYRDRLERIVA